eukprot:gene22240-30481_t
MGICGVLDHSGVRISLHGIYSTVDHSYHHEKFNNHPHNDKRNAFQHIARLPSNCEYVT